MKRGSYEGTVLSALSQQGKRGNEQCAYTSQPLVLLLPDAYYDFIESLVDSSQRASLRPVHDMQVVGKASVPDAILKQRSFQVVIETKLYGQFTLQQLTNHLNHFSDEDFMVLLTLDANDMAADFKSKLDAMIDKKNQSLSRQSRKQSSIHHAHLTFEEFGNRIKALVDEGDSQMTNICEDYIDCCREEGLISNDYKMLMAVPVGKTYDDNKNLKLYYCPRDRSFRPHQYIGLYKDKAIQDIGKVICQVITEPNGNGALSYTDAATGNPINDSNIVKRIDQAISNALTGPGYDLAAEAYRFFIVDEFYETNFIKSSPYGLLGVSYFDLEQFCADTGLSFSQSQQPSEHEIAHALRGKTWL